MGGGPPVHTNSDTFELDAEDGRRCSCWTRDRTLLELLQVSPSWCGAGETSLISGNVETRRHSRHILPQRDILPPVDILDMHAPTIAKLPLA